MALGYAFHLGLLVVLLLFVPHIEFFHGVIGISWSGVSNDLVMVSAVIAVGALVALLFHRIANPVQRILSTADDYLSWLLTLLPLLTGLMATAHLGPRYETMLAWHLLTVEAFLIWFPFGKLMHTALVFPSRIEMGANYARRGVEI
jgi:nitrate reductase gamma subunit